MKEQLEILRERLPLEIALFDVWYKGYGVGIAFPLPIFYHTNDHQWIMRWFWEKDVVKTQIIAGGIQSWVYRTNWTRSSMPFEPKNILWDLADVLNDGTVMVTGLQPARVFAFTAKNSRHDASLARVRSATRVGTPLSPPPIQRSASRRKMGRH